jgi:hypothetical protein
MTGLNFSNGRLSSFNVVSKNITRADAPFDASLSFNRLISNNPEDPTGNIYSIDAEKILRQVSREKFDALTKITLACRPDQRSSGSLAIWDVLFNTIQRKSFNAVIMAAKNDYSPLAMNRVVVSSSFLDYTRPVSRIHLNRIEVSDTLGIAIYDTVNNYTYVLMYSIAGTCSVQLNQNNANEDRPLSIPSVNCILTRVHRIDDDGSAMTVEFSEDDYSDKEGPFVGWLFNSVNDIPEAYPWKPHFLPFTPNGYNREAIEKSLDDITLNLDNDEEPRIFNGRYEDFEEFCRLAYKEAKIKKDLTKGDTSPPVVDNSKKDRRGQKRRGPRENKLPIASLFKLGEYYIGSVVVEDEFRAVRFHENTLGDRELVETYLTTKDIVGSNLIENGSVLLLSSVGSEDHIFRYLTVNF